ncbi:Uma2 family endonuclease [Streptomyces cellulosae]
MPPVSRVPRSPCVSLFCAAVRIERRPGSSATMTRCEDVVLIAEVIARKTADNDYGPKKDAYAAAGVPVYLIVDPYTGEWHLHTLPKDGKYHGSVCFDFGIDIDLTRTAVDLILRTDDFPRG